jgi:HAD superfamily hydrolase (TIGR01549 family)
MDDTLFDHTYALRTAVAAAWSEDLGLRRRSLRSVIGEYERLLDDVHPDVLRGRKTHAEARQERFRRLFEWVESPRPPVELQEISTRYRSRYQGSRRPVAGAAALLRGLHGRATVGIVSNNHTPEQKEKMAAIGIGPYVDFLLTSEDAEAEKPDPVIFRRALERAAAGPQDAVMVGDNWSTDIVGARALGLRSIWLNRRGLPRPDRREDVLEVRTLRPARPLRDQLLAEGPWRGEDHRSSDSGL